MRKTIADVVNDLRDRLGVVTGQQRLERLFNEVQRQIAEECECIAGEWETTLKGYLAETGLTAIATTNTHQVTAVMSDVDTNDYYNGWLLKNITRQAEAWIIDSVANGVSQVLTLSNGITGQVATDTFQVERISHEVVMPWYMIRPFQKRGGVWWDKYEVIPGDNQTINNSMMQRLQGTPRKFVQRNQSLLIIPHPTSTKVVRVYGPRRSPECFYTVTTSSGGSGGQTIKSANIPLQVDDYYKGARVMILSGTYLGEIREISEYDASEVTFYFKTPFSGQIVSAVNFELESLLPLSCEPVVQHYLKWRILERSQDKELQREAMNEMRLFREMMDLIDSIEVRQKTGHAFLGQSYTHYTTTYNIQETS